MTQHAITTPVTVSIVTYKSTDALLRCIASIEQHLPSVHEIIIVQHDTVPLRIPPSPTLRIISAPNRGFGAGHNQAITAAKSDIVLILNPDATLTHSIESAVAHFSKPDVAIVGMRIQNANACDDRFCCGKDPSIGRIFINHLQQKKLPKTTEVTDWVSGACMLVRRSDFLAIGGFDEQFFLYFEDADLCRRMRIHGKKVLFEPSVVIQHVGGVSFHSKREQKKHYDASQDIYFKRYGTPIARHIIRYCRTLWRMINPPHP